MGTFVKGILGAFSGKVGTVVGSTWKGIPVMKSVVGTAKRQPDTSPVRTAGKIYFDDKVSSAADGFI